MIVKRRKEGDDRDVRFVSSSAELNNCRPRARPVRICIGKGDRTADGDNARPSPRQCCETFAGRRGCRISCLLSLNETSWDSDFSAISSVSKEVDISVPLVMSLMCHVHRGHSMWWTHVSDDLSCSCYTCLFVCLHIVCTLRYDAIPRSIISLLAQHSRMPSQFASQFSSQSVATINS